MAPSERLRAVRGVVERHRAAIERDLAAVLGDASLCTASRSAGPVPAVKYHEGRFTAVSELGRLLRDADDRNDPDEVIDEVVAEVVGEAIARWRAALDRDIELDRSIDWRAYRAGGVDELVAVAAELEGD